MLLPWAVASSALALAQIGDVEEALSRSRRPSGFWMNRQRVEPLVIVAGPTLQSVALVCCSDDSVGPGTWAIARSYPRSASPALEPMRCIFSVIGEPFT